MTSNQLAILLSLMVVAYAAGSLIGVFMWGDYITRCFEDEVVWLGQCTPIDDIMEQWRR